MTDAVHVQPLDVISGGAAPGPAAGAGPGVTRGEGGGGHTHAGQVAGQIRPERSWCEPRQIIQILSRRSEPYHSLHETIKKHKLDLESIGSSLGIHEN